MVVVERKQRHLEAELPETVVGGEEREATGRVARAVMDLDALVVARVAQLERAVEDARLAHRPRHGEHVAARDLARRDADEVDRDALPGRGARDRLVVHLHAAHAHRPRAPLAADELERLPLARSRPTRACR